MAWKNMGSAGVSKRLALLTLIAGLMAFAGAETVSFAVGEWEPYTGEKMAGNGLAYELVAASCNASGITVKSVWVPWKRAEAGVAEGVYFGTFPYQKTAERQKMYLYSGDFLKTNIGVVRHTDNAKAMAATFSRVEDLRGAGFSS